MKSISFKININGYNLNEKNKLISQFLTVTEEILPIRDMTLRREISLFNNSRNSSPRYEIQHNIMRKFSLYNQL